MLPPPPCLKYTLKVKWKVLINLAKEKKRGRLLLLIKNIQLAWWLSPIVLSVQDFTNLILLHVLTLTDWWLAKKTDLIPFLRTPVSDREVRIKHGDETGPCNSEQCFQSADTSWRMSIRWNSIGRSKRWVTFRFIYIYSLENSYIKFKIFTKIDFQRHERGQWQLPLEKQKVLSNPNTLHSDIFPKPFFIRKCNK